MAEWDRRRHSHTELLVHGDVAARNELLDEYKWPNLTNFGTTRATESSKRVAVSRKLPMKWAAHEQVEQSAVPGEQGVRTPSHSAVYCGRYLSRFKWPGISTTAAA